MNQDRMTPEALAEIEGLAAAATEGLWEHELSVGKRYYVRTPSYGVHDFCYLVGGIEREADAAFIAASRTAVPQMAAEIRRAWAENKELRDALKGAEVIASQAKGHLAENARLKELLDMAITGRNHADDVAIALRAELEAAKEDMRALSDEYKFCNMCKYHNGEGVDTCSHPLRFSCDAENFYEWCGVPANTPVQGATDETMGGGGNRIDRTRPVWQKAR